MRDDVSVEKRKAPSANLKIEILVAQALCKHCQKQLSIGDVQYDHIIPLELGGEHCAENLQALCVSCHKIKTAKDVGDIRQAARRKNVSKTGRSSTRKRKKIVSPGFDKRIKRKMNGEIIFLKPDGEEE